MAELSPPRALLCTSAVLRGVRHGFSTRHGGVSLPPYASLNLGQKWGDAPAAVAENLGRLAAAGGFDPKRLFTVSQVHGAEVVTVVQSDAVAAVGGREADALVTAVPGVALGVHTADCVPILLADDAGRIGVAHAGWRGTVLGIAERTVEALVALGAEPARLRAALGPSICQRCFEVGDEVAAEFARVAPSSVSRVGGAKAHVDLWDANRAQLVASGLAPDHLDACPPCTMCHEEDYFSYRRDHRPPLFTGQQLSFVCVG